MDYVEKALNFIEEKLISNEQQIDPKVYQEFFQGFDFITYR